jgi:hypothetical protein
MKRTLKRELKVLEIAGREANGSCGCTPVGRGIGLRWSATQRGVLVSVGYRGGTSAGNRSPPMPLRWPRNEARAFTGVVSTNCALGTLAY